MLSAIDALSPGSAVLLHASCHNPTGADLSESHWRAVLEIVRRRRLLPFIDMAYQGLGAGVEEDAFGIRLFASELPELLVAVSCSKNFGLYRERAGALHIVTESAQASQAALSHQARIARRLYSMPPDHGAAIVSRILSEEALGAAWRRELEEMRRRIVELRRQLVQALAEACPDRDFGFIATQRGMFSFLGISPEQVRALRAEHHIYMTEDSRINIAGLRCETVAYVAQAIAQVI
jgi:aspartate aminotransferase